MATAGLSFANPMLSSMSVGEQPNPYAPFSPTSSIGMGGLAPSAADIAVTGEALVKQSQFTMPEMRRPPSIAFSPSSKKMFVNGLTFDADDAATALQSESYLRGPGTQLPTGGDWVPLDEQSYGQYLQSIRQPSLGRLMSKTFGRGVDALQMRVGSGLQLLGAEDLGGRIVAAQEEDLRKTSPFERQFTDIDSGRSAVEWIVANLAQQGPNLLESLAFGLAGAAAGTAAAGPVGTAVGGLAGILGRKTVKDKILDAAKKYAAGEAKPGSSEYALLRNTAALAGATAANFASNLATGASDIYGEMREQGVGPEDSGARLKALAGSVLYAGLDTVGEYFIASRLLGGGRAALPKEKTTTRVAPGGKTTITTGPTLGGTTAEYAKRFGIGFGIGAPLEGTTELGQEALVMGLSGQDLTSNEAINRFINSFAAGAAVGGPLGGLANLRSKNPDGTPSAKAKSEVNLLDSTGAPTPPAADANGQLLLPLQGGTAPALPTEFPGAAPGMQGVLDVGVPGAPMTAQEAGLRGLPGPSRAAVPAPTGAMPQQLSLFEPPTGAMPQQLSLFEPPTTGIPLPPGQQFEFPMGAGTQGQLDLTNGFGLGTPPALPAPAARMERRVTAPQPNPAQGVLQFAPPAPLPPPGGTPMAAAMARAVRTQDRNAAYEQRAAQEAAQRQADLDRLANVGAAQRQLDLVAPAAPAPMPMRRTGPTQPQQLQLFRGKRASRPSSAERLRRGQQRVAAPAPQVEVPLTAAQRRAQLALLTQEGQPTVAALKAAGVKTRVEPTPPKAPVVRARTQRGLKKQAGVAAVEIVTPEVSDAAQEGKLKQGRVAKRPEGDAGVRTGGDVGQQPKAQVAAGGAQAGGGSVAIKRGTKQEAPVTEAKKEEPKTETATQDKERLRKERLQEMLRRGELKQAGEQWSQYADRETQPKWSELSDAQKEAWRKVVVDDRKPSMAATEEIAPPKTETPTGPKPQAAQAAVSAAPEGPIAITLELSNGDKLKIKDAKKLRDTLDKDIIKFEALLTCLKAAT